jgi:hypothetical protein
MDLGDGLGIPLGNGLGIPLRNGVEIPPRITLRIPLRTSAESSSSLANYSEASVGQQNGKPYDSRA